jgi:hypothetical protein
MKRHKKKARFGKSTVDAITRKLNNNTGDRTLAVLSKSFINNPTSQSAAPINDTSKHSQRNAPQTRGQDSSSNVNSCYSQNTLKMIKYMI